MCYYREVEIPASQAHLFDYKMIDDYVFVVIGADNQNNCFVDTLKVFDTKAAALQYKNDLDFGTNKSLMNENNYQCCSSYLKMSKVNLGSPLCSSVK